MIGIIVPVLVAVGLAVTPPQADSVGAAVSAPSESTAAAEATPTLPSAGAQTTGGLPPRPAPPVTMRDQWPIFVLFALTWVGIIGYLVATGRRAARLMDDVVAREVSR